MAPRGRPTVCGPRGNSLGDLVRLGEVLHPGGIVKIRNRETLGLQVPVRNSALEHVLADTVQGGGARGLLVLVEHGVVHGQVHVAGEAVLHLQRLAALDHGRPLRHRHAAHEAHIGLRRGCALAHLGCAYRNRGGLDRGGNHFYLFG
eukprot:1177002-Prorocentrum_minimum.AAC.3